MGVCIPFLLKEQLNLSLLYFSAEGAVTGQCLICDFDGINCLLRHWLF